MSRITAAALFAGAVIASTGAAWAESLDAGADAQVIPSDAAAVPPAAAHPGAPPVPLDPIQPAYPPEALKAGLEGEVALILTVDELGQVTKVEVESGPALLAEAAVAAARIARFRAALDPAGRPFAARLRWIVHFALPEVRKPAPAPETPAPAAPAREGTPAAAEEALPPNVERFQVGAKGILAVRVRQKGTGKVLPEATVFLEDVGELLRVDAQGTAWRVLPPGAYVLVIRAPGHHQEERIERVRSREQVVRTYFVERQRLNEYETVINAPPPRAETGVVSLQAEEIRGIPGTFGDPFRVAMLMPGVASPISGLGYPVIRGESPGQTGTFIDDVKVPLLYHLGFGPAVVHPSYIEALDFHPGNFPAEFGRFTGGLIRAKTTGIPSERQTMLEADLFKFSAYHAQAFSVGAHGGAFTAAARYGTFAFLARALDPTAVLSYWDYQTRSDLSVGPGTLRLLVFGANDDIGERQVVQDGVTIGQNQLVRIGFHRADLRYRLQRRAGFAAEAGIEVGPDYTRSTGSPTAPTDAPPGGGATGAPNDNLRLREWVIRPRVIADYVVGPKLKLRGGLEALHQRWTVEVGQEVEEDVDLRGREWPRTGWTFGAFAQAEWAPTPAWLIAPGLRTDVYAYQYSDARDVKANVNPRLAARRRVLPGLYLKAAAGIYHSPPRFLLPWPGLTGFGLRRNGLNRSDQVSGGVEIVLPWDATVDAQAYYGRLARVSEYDLSGVLGDSGDDSVSLEPRVGRTYGFEVIARRRLGHRFFGWLTYSLSRAERRHERVGWRPADFDQTHLLNAVLAYALGRSWTISATFHANSGRPHSPRTEDPSGDNFGGIVLPESRNAERLPSFWRIDARIEKREAFDTWYLDFYVDWFNVSMSREVTGYEYDFGGGTGVRRTQSTILTIPTLGLRVVF